MPSLEALSVIPQEIIGGRRLQSTAHVPLSKKIIVDVSNTKKLSTAMTCTDATNLYDRLLHPYASLCAHYFGMYLSYLSFLFRTIQKMKLHLRTAIGV